jgi:hypothetical protein
MDLAEEHKMLTTSPTSRYALAKSFSLRLLPRRLYAIGTDPTKSDILLSRLFKLSLHSLRGYAEVKELTSESALVNLIDVVAEQRYAQCRELAVLLGYLDSAPESALREVTALKLEWKKALSSLKTEDVIGFTRHACKAERRLQSALLAAAKRIGSKPVTERLQNFAMNISSLCERMEELMSEQQS